MDAQHTRQAAAKQNNRLLMGGAAAAVLIYYFYKKRQGDVTNVGDAVSGSKAIAEQGFAGKRLLSPPAPSAGPPDRCCDRARAGAGGRAGGQHGPEVGGQGLRGQEMRASREGGGA